MTTIRTAFDQDLEARSLRIVERDLDRALLALRRVADLGVDAAETLEPYDPDRAADLRERIWTAALSLDQMLEVRT